MLKFTIQTYHGTLHIPRVILNFWRILHFTLTLYTLNCTLHTLHPKLYASHFTRRTPQSTLYTHTQCTLGTPDSTCTRGTHTLICTLSHFTLYTSHRTPQPCHFHTWHCMEPWPGSIVMLRAHIVILNFRQSLLYFFPHFQKSTPVP